LTDLSKCCAVAAVVAACLGVSGAHSAETTFSRQSIAAKAADSRGYPDVVAVSGKGKSLFLWGVGAEEETSKTAWRPDVRHRGDFAAQCTYSLDKLGRMLATRGATFNDVTVIRAYITDSRYTGALYDCLDTVYGKSSAKPAVTSANISQLAHAGMLVELELTAALPDTASDSAFTVYRNTQTLGTWNPGANEVLEVSGPDRTFYFSGAHAVAYKPGEPMVAMYPGDFAKQCDWLQQDLLRVLKAEGAVAKDVVRSTTFLAGDAGLAELLACRSKLPKEDAFVNPGTLANISQLSALGETYTYDSIGMAALPAGSDPKTFVKKVVPSKIDAAVPSAVIVSGPRRTLNVAGQGAIDAAGAVLFPGDFMAQCQQTVQTLGTLLGAQGASIRDIAKMLVFVTDSRDAPAFRTCMAKAYPNVAQPAQTFVNVARLPKKGMMIQIDATAVTAP
jgi:enamine deaminase RidA (YjgF/YER057c/UK114 family)